MRKCCCNLMLPWIVDSQLWLVFAYQPFIMLGVLKYYQRNRYSLKTLCADLFTHFQPCQPNLSSFSKLVWRRVCYCNSQQSNLDIKPQQWTFIKRIPTMRTQQCAHFRSDCWQQWTDLADGEWGALLGAPAHRESPRVARVAPLQQDTQQLGHRHGHGRYNITHDQLLGLQ